MAARAVAAAYLLALTIGFVASYSDKCASGPTYWCQSIQNADDCGAVRHCADTVWRSDKEPALTDASTGCQWCQRILENTHTSIQTLTDQKDLIVSTLASGCQLLPANDFSSKCANMVTNYAESVTSLMQYKRYATLCRLIHACSSEPSDAKPPVVVGQHRCTWGPSYWCSSLSNARECGSIAHCSSKIWSQQSITKKPSDNVCQYCEFVVAKLRAILVNSTVKIDVQKWLAGACSMLQNKEIIDQCVQTLSKYGEEILIMINDNIDPGVICHLGEMCKDATIVVRSEKEVLLPDRIDNAATVADEQARMLCTTIVRATYELYANQERSESEIQLFLRNDCQQLQSAELIYECESFVDRYGGEIYKHVDDHKALSTVCNYVLGEIDSSASQVTPQDLCKQCTFVVATAKGMFEIGQTQDEVFAYLDEYLCASLTGEELSECKADLQNEREETLEEIRSEVDAAQICQTSPFCSEIASAEEADAAVNECTRCQNDVNTRQENFRAVLNALATARLARCQNDGCRSRVLSHQQERLNNINQVSAIDYCQRLARCSPPFMTDLLSTNDSDAELSESVCSRFGNWRSTCSHLLISSESAQYMRVYLAMLQKDSHPIIEALHDQSITACDACKTVAQSTHDFWSTALDSVRDALRQTCESCPTRDRCRQFWNERFDYVKADLDKLDPQQLCQMIHLCSALPSSDSCSTCIERFQSRKYAALRAADRLAADSTDVCQRFATTQCQAYVTKVHEAVQKFIEAFDSKETCAASGFCTADGQSTGVSFDQYEANIRDELESGICSTLGSFEALCQAIVRGDGERIQTMKLTYEIQVLLQTGEGQDDCSRDKCCRCMHRVTQRKRRMRFIGDAMFFALIRSCDRCPEKHQCRRHYLAAKARFDCHIDRINPKRVCTHFGFCNMTAVLDGPILKSEQNCAEVVETTEKPFSQSADLSNSTCVLCEYAMNILSNYINRQSTEEEIERNLQALCQQMPSVLQDQCHEYVDNYSPAIIASLLREFDLSTVCHKLNLCMQSMQVELTHVVRADVVNCGVCNYVSAYLHAALQRTSTDESIARAVSTVCSHLPDEHLARCQTMLQLFSPYVRQLELNPSKSFCKQLPICETPMIDLRPAVLLTSTTDGDTVPHLTPKCTLCQYVINYLDAVMKSNKSEQAFAEALKKVCTILPGKERSQCEQFIEAYGSTLAQMIVDMADPLTICRSLNMCENVATEKPTVVTDSTGEQTAYTCMICQYMVSRMKYFTGINQKENDVLQSLREACNLFNVDELKQQCKAFIDRQGAYFLKTISNDVQPRLACQSIHICKGSFATLPETTTAVPTSTSVKYSKCLFGPKYWCASRGNAKLCQAENFCERQGWPKNADWVY